LIGLKSRALNERAFHHLVSWLWLRVRLQHSFILLLDNRDLLKLRLGTSSRSG
jgi:hypothetical protein